MTDRRNPAENNPSFAYPLEMQCRTLPDGAEYPCTWWSWSGKRLFTARGNHWPPRGIWV